MAQFTLTTLSSKELKNDDRGMSMKKIAITGVSGFVAGHFIDYLYKNDIECEIL